MRPVAWALVVSVMLAIAGCSPGSGGDVPSAETNIGSTGPSTVIPSITLPSATSLPPISATPTALGASFAELESTLAGSVGIAYAPVGGGAPPAALGDWSHGSAWSTIKVPLAVAAFRQSGSAADQYAVAAITRSDNDAAEQLWELLGAPVTAGAAVQRVLAEAGDTATVVETRKVRPEFSAFGQTDWALADQVGFAADLPCLPMAERVFELMGSVTADQQWGLAAIPGARFKGGWGPDSASGGYLVRQFGVITTPAGQTAVALAAMPDSGSFAEGTAILTKIGNWLAVHAAELPGGTCP